MGKNGLFSRKIHLLGIHGKLKHYLVPSMSSINPTRAEMREGLEKKVLTLALADLYGKFPAKLAMERGITFTPMPNWRQDRTSPASNSCLLSVDHDAYDPSPQKGNLMLSDNGEGTFFIKNYQK